MLTSRLFQNLSKTAPTTLSRSLSFELTDTQREIQGAALQFAKEVILPQAAHFDKTMEFPWDIVKQAHSLGIMNPQIPAKYGRRLIF
jgi:acyl-CoA dehydrogenase